MNKVSARGRLTQEDVERFYPMYETMRLRFIDRDGRKILQQYFVRPSMPIDLIPIKGYTACEWRDVPLEEI